jgi:serine/threonine-protein kinase
MGKAAQAPVATSPGAAGGSRPTADDRPGAGAARPQRYGRYLLVDSLAVGGMAEVFRALVLGPESFQRMVVVKRMLPALSSDPRLVEMFIDEATLCGRLFHPNVIQVYEFGEQDGRYFIAMEYVQGQNLLNVMARLARTGRRMPVQVAADIARQVCRGLAYAHELPGADGRPLGVIHRDISPVNVMVSYAGAVKVVDFGIARVTDAFRLASTDPGQVKGKSAYLAPEQLAGVALDHRVDIFAAGILLHEMLTGRRLFKGATPADTVDLLRKMRIPDVSVVNPAVPARLEGVVMRALRRAPAERYQSAAEMADELERFLVAERFSSQEVPQFMRTLFGKESARDQVYFGREQLRALVATTSRETGDETIGASLPDAARQARPAVTGSGTVVLPRRRRGRPRLLTMGAVGGAVALGGVLALAFAGGGARMSPSTARASGASPARRALGGTFDGEAGASTVAPAAPARAPVSRAPTWDAPLDGSPNGAAAGVRARERTKLPSRSKAEKVKYGIIVDPFAP